MTSPYTPIGQRTAPLFNTFVFDLDGTLLNTLPDLVELTNATLRACGFPEHTQEEVLGYVGSGVQALIRMAVPANTPEETIRIATEHWKELYPEYGYKLTRPYEGIPETLAALKERGCTLAVLSNKFDEAVHEVVETFFPNVFDSVHGESPTFPRKPDPRGLHKLLTELNASPNNCVMVGDSANDINVAHAADIYSIAVSWGYNEKRALEAYKPNLMIAHPQQLLELADSKNAPVDGTR